MLSEQKEKKLCVTTKIFCLFISAEFRYIILYIGKGPTLFLTIGILFAVLCLLGFNKERSERLLQLPEEAPI